MKTENIQWTVRRNTQHGRDFKKGGNGQTINKKLFWPSRLTLKNKLRSELITRLRVKWSCLKWSTQEDLIKIEAKEYGVLREMTSSPNMIWKIIRELVKQLKQENNTVFQVSGQETQLVFWKYEAKVKCIIYRFKIPWFHKRFRFLSSLRL